jgi:hypothetical protein
VRTNIYQRKGAEVLLKTILNRVQKYKGFIYESLAWRDQSDDPTIDVRVVARSNSRAVCSGCGKRRPGYDRITHIRMALSPRGHYRFVQSAGTGMGDLSNDGR